MVEAALTCGLQISIRQPEQGQEVARGTGRQFQNLEPEIQRVKEVSVQDSLELGCGGNGELGTFGIQFLVSYFLWHMQFPVLRTLFSTVSAHQPLCPPGFCSALKVSGKLPDS